MTGPPGADARSIGEYLISSRSVAEYQAMFALTEHDLTGRRCWTAPAVGPLHRTACTRRVNAVALDPTYLTPAAELAARLTGELERGSARTTDNADRYIWDFYGNPAAHARMRADSAQLFSEDLVSHPERYMSAAPRLPFPDDSFGLVLSSHLLFIYAGRLDVDCHRAALRPMIRVSRGQVCVYPLVDQAGEPQPAQLEELLPMLVTDGVRATVRDVDHEFQRGARSLLQLDVVAGP